MIRFKNRREAGRELAKKLMAYAGQDTVVLGLPRGGIPVAYEIATALSAQLDVFVVRKLGVPWYPETAMGAIAGGGIVILNRSVVSELNIDKDMLDSAIHKEEQELKRRERLYRGQRSFPDLSDKVVILVDDGLATGATMYAAVLGVQNYEPRSIVVAVPVASRMAADYLEKHADKVIYLVLPEPFYGVGLSYRDFTQVTDDEVCKFLGLSTLLPRSA